MQNQNPHDQEDEDLIQAAKKRNVTPPTRVYSKDCIFCEKVNYIRSTSSQEPLVKMKTVNEILSKSDEIRKALNLKKIVVMDQALYAKAAEIKWQRPNTYSSIILRLGTFHTIAIRCPLLENALKTPV